MIKTKIEVYGSSPLSRLGDTAKSLVQRDPGYDVTVSENGIESHVRPAGDTIRVRLTGYNGIIPQGTQELATQAVYGLSRLYNITPENIHATGINLMRLRGEVELERQLDYRQAA